MILKLMKSIIEQYPSSPKVCSGPFVIPPFPLPHPSHQAHFDLLFEIIDLFAFSRVLYKWNHQFVLFIIWLLSLSMIILKSSMFNTCQSVILFAAA